MRNTANTDPGLHRHMHECIYHTLTLTLTNTYTWMRHTNRERKRPTPLLHSFHVSM